MLKTDHQTNLPAKYFSFGLTTIFFENRILLRNGPLLELFLWRLY
jgi:hypothetical protein